MDYSKHYSEESWSKKLAGLAGKASSSLTEKALTLYVILKSPETPNHARIMIIAALGYFICPVDAVPDFLPFGFADDIAVMAGVLMKLKQYHTEEVDKEVRRLRK